ncbi:universal stress protein [Natrononativus amylolyticus]|uniref:universal stress protein n=1 Tax=Natrononativus amylolyticus TaxID=2963434 RepID=UPI0020CDE211|nr:universal stress protein [Natrononativus amylolyticus]
MGDRILVPIDDSEPAREALTEALELFATEQIVVLHVLDTNESSHGIEGGAADGWYEAKKEEAEELFEDAQAVADEYDAPLETAIESGRPDRTIVDYATEHGVDHIVMGSHGRSGVSRILVGSVAESVIRNAPVSVTIARRRSAVDE